ncbi:MAG: hypothetical protein ABJE10_18620 [bacterium]
MAVREITDERGEVWQVFAVHPGTESGANSLTDTFKGGWLCFLSGKGRRRVAPIPEGWEAMSDHSLRRMLSVAPPTGESPRAVK